ncbi:MAG: 30S ribosome-binding factor RbfA [Candidatus Omnitrophica bacterium]|nr:30S ribosome-binding factor RbfA [Candidatus Omnitrophota bacterium]
MSQARIERVSQEIKKEIGAMLHGEIKDPRIGFITITKVELSRDLHLAKVYFSFLGTDKQLRDTQVGLQRSRGFIRKLLGERIKIRYTPEIIFKFDKNLEYSVHIQEVIDKIKLKEEKDAHERKKSN